MTDHPVVDMTGLSGKYEMTLDISMQELMNVGQGRGGRRAAPAHRRCRVRPGQYRRYGRAGGGT